MLKDIIIAFLLKSHKENRLAEVDDHGYRFSFTYAWNDFVHNGENTKSYLFDTLVDDLTRTLFSKIMAPTKEQEEKLLKQALIDLENGTLYSPLSLHTIGSGVVKDSFGLRLVNWHPEFFLSKKPDLPLQKLTLPAINTATITFPTGHLFISDWIRIKGLADIVRDESFNISYGAERVRRTQAGISTHNVIEIAVGDCGPTIFEHDNSLLFSRFKYDEVTDTEQAPHLQEVGDVCADYWGTTIIDIADIKTILNTAGLDSQTLIQDYLDTPHNNLTQLHVAPGKWEVTWFEYAMAANGKTCLEDYMPMPGNVKTIFSLRKLP